MIYVDQSVSELVCELQGAGGSSHAESCLMRIAGLLQSSSEARTQLSDTDGAWDVFCSAASAAPTAAADVLRLAAKACSPREVFMLACATLSEGLR